LSVYEKLAALKIKLAEVTPPVAAFLSFVRVGSLVFLSGHIGKKNGTPWVGQLGVNVTTGREAKYHSITKAGVKALSEETGRWRQLSGLVEKLLTEER
jgi:enamine deaminase RidA (YjgF/YER057c/UK114 family)